MRKGFNIKGQIRSFSLHTTERGIFIIQLVISYDKKPRFPVPAAYLTYFSSLIVFSDQLKLQLIVCCDKYPKATC